MESYLKIGIEFRNNSRIGLSDDKESLKAEVATGGVLCKKLVLKNFANFTGKHQCKICEIFKNTYFEEHLGTTASLKVKEPYMTSTRKWEREVSKFVACLWILLFLNNRSIVDFCEWWGGSQKMVIFCGRHKWMTP